MKRLQSIYVALGINGLLKVGITSNRENRIKALSLIFRKNGDALSVIEFCEQMLVGGYVESQLILHVQGILTQHSGREWFIDNGKFRDIVLVAKSLTAERVKTEASRPDFRKMIRAIKAKNAEATKVIAKYERKISRANEILKSIKSEYARQISKAMKAEKEAEKNSAEKA